MAPGAMSIHNCPTCHCESPAEAQERREREEQERKRQEQEREREFVRKHSVLTDEDIRWARAQLDRRAVIGASGG